MPNLLCVESISHCFWENQYFLVCTEKISYISLCTDKKENKIFLIYKEIQMGSGAKSYMRKGFLVYEEMHKYFHHIWGGRWSYMTLHPIPLNFLIYEENFSFFFNNAVVFKKNRTFYRWSKGPKIYMVQLFTLWFIGFCKKMFFLFL